MIHTHIYILTCIGVPVHDLERVSVCNVGHADLQVVAPGLAIAHTHAHHVVARMEEG